MDEPWLKDHVPLAGRAFIDVGANTGSWAKWLATGYQVVHAIEPHPANLEILCEDLPANVIVHPIAAWSVVTRITFKLYDSPAHTSAYWQDEGLETGEPIGYAAFEAQPLDDIIPDDPPVDLIKIDTEGAEADVHEGVHDIVIVLI